MTVGFYIAAFMMIVSSDLVIGILRSGEVLLFIINAIIYLVPTAGIYYWKRKEFFETKKWPIITFVVYCVVNLVATLIMMEL